MCSLGPLPNCYDSSPQFSQLPHHSRCYPLPLWIRKDEDKLWTGQVTSVHSWHCRTLGWLRGLPGLPFISWLFWGRSLPSFSTPYDVNSCVSLESYLLCSNCAVPEGWYQDMTLLPSRPLLASPPRWGMAYEWTLIPVSSKCPRPLPTWRTVPRWALVHLVKRQNFWWVPLKLLCNDSALKNLHVIGQIHLLRLMAADP